MGPAVVLGAYDRSMPSATHRLSNVVPYALSIVKRGANGQSFFLRKSDGAVLIDQFDSAEMAAGDIEPLRTMPHADDLIAKADWSAVYCVVASPSAVENGGMLSPDVWDQWADAEEIRKAAHAFMRNGALVNKMHEDLAPYGQIVENAIALVDLEVEGTVIEKGSWYVAIEPTDEGVEAIESGEFTGISIEGTGSRAEISKADPKAQGTKGKDRAGAASYQTCSGCGGKVKLGAKTCPSCGHALSGYTGKGKMAKAKEKPSLPITNKPGKTNYIEQAGGFPKELRDLIEHLKAGPPPRTDSKAIQLGIGIMQNFAHGHDGNGRKISAEKTAKWAAVMAQYDALPAKARANKVKKETSVSKFLKAVGAALGIDPAEYDVQTEGEEIEKAATSTFSQRIAAREIEDDLPMAMDVLRSSIYDSIYPFVYGYADAPAPADARASLDTSLAQFHEYLLGVYDGVVGDSIAKSRDELLADLATLGSNEGTTGAETEEDDDIMGEPATKIEKLETDVAAIGTKVDGLVESLAPLLKRVQEETAPTVEDLSKSIETLTEQLGTIAKGVERLGAGGSNQDDDETVVKSDDPLAGILA